MSWYVSVKVCRCQCMQALLYADVKVSGYVSVKVCRCQSMQVLLYADIKVCRCQCKQVYADVNAC
jgi:hypothetical protein